MIVTVMLYKSPQFFLSINNYFSVHLFHFRAFELDPSFQLPVKTVRKYLDIEYPEKKETVRHLLSQQPSVALTTDMWSSGVKQGYIIVTSHFIDEKWNMRRGVLITCHMPESHTGDNIARRILEKKKQNFSSGKSQV